jgi:cytochrome c-type biogenesis protein CcmE
MKPRHKKLIAITLGVTTLVAAGLLVLNAFRSNIVYFRSPTEILSGAVPTQGTLRLGGMVDRGSVQKTPGTLKVSFKVTDYEKCLTVQYEGILPDLFREGQGVITQGKLQPNNTFAAEQVLAKHDEKYMPPEVAKSLKGTGGPAPFCK